ncbi:crossover junction endodeoxyribonuclease RuvC [Chlorobium sp. KB01]|uniref:crossover junction endodeoxyribonuclease RuvC n=1 Tax=Chlorobium sp. KB01 TaxID=1917528 RepID=UPI0009769689|nr:crossover junction endodeoxyribonuclease RuvC [Chlorobium sp. KB01]
MVVLGIDPGSLITGYGVIRQESGVLRVLASGVIRMQASRSHAERIGQIYRELDALITAFAPDRVVLETVFLNKNVQSALKLGQVRGAVIALVMSRNLLLHEYAPREVKSAVTGRGSATKEQVAFMVGRLLGLNPVPEPFDVTDALGIALCDLLRGESRDLVIPQRKSRSGGGSWSKFVTESPDLVIRG